MRINTIFAIIVKKFLKTFRIPLALLYQEPCWMNRNSSNSGYCPFSRRKLIKKTMEENNNDSFVRAVDSIVNAITIYIFAVKSSFALARFLGYYLELIFGNVKIIETTSKSEMYEQLFRTGENDVIVGIQSSIIRGGLKNGSNNLAIMKIFDGVSEDLSNVKIGALSGEELVGLITENIKSNLKNPKRNTLIQWSDIKINRTLISDIVEGKSKKDFSDAIQVRNNITNEFEPINLNKKYKIAIGEKFLVKDDIEWPGRIRDRFVSLDRTYDKLLRSYISSDEINYQLKVTPKTKENRIY